MIRKANLKDYWQLLKLIRQYQHFNKFEKLLMPFQLISYIIKRNCCCFTKGGAFIFGATLINKNCLDLIIIHSGFRNEHIGQELLTHAETIIKNKYGSIILQAHKTSLPYFLKKGFSINQKYVMMCKP